jgi:hypothetical protein
MYSRPPDSEGGQLDQEIDVIRLNLCLVCRLVSADLTAFITAVNDNISLFGVGLHLDRAQNTAAGIGTVTGIDIHVQGAKTARTVIAGAIAQGLYGQTAIFANEGIVIFRKSFLFHKIVSVIF